MNKWANKQVLTSNAYQYEIYFLSLSGLNILTMADAEEKP